MKRAVVMSELARRWPAIQIEASDPAAHEVTTSPALMLRVEASKTGGERLARALAGGTQHFTLSALDGSVTVRVRLSGAELDVTDSCNQGGLVVNWNRRTISSEFGSTQLSPTELRLLASLMECKGVAVANKDLVKSTWPHLNGDGQPKNLLAVYVHSLRQRLRAVGTASALETVRGVGYRIRA